MKNIYINVKNRERKTHISTHAVISRRTLNISEAAQFSLPSLKSIKKYVKLIKYRDNSILPNRQTLSPLIIPDIYKVSLSREVFLIHDNNSPTTTLVLASCISALRRYIQSGYFDIYKLFTIHEDVFAIIRGVVDGYQPGTILMDFEMSMMNAARNILHDSSIKGGLLHLGQCIWIKYRNQSYNISPIISRIIGLDETGTKTLEEMLDLQSTCGTLCPLSWMDKRGQTTPLEGGITLSISLWDQAFEIYGFFLKPFKKSKILMSIDFHKLMQVRILIKEELTEISLYESKTQ
ncbi:hypothetical protein RF11_15615 [Thelohanellus kitauei]|uniref:MULE transposase domain-containing protein n=1 Tax=Thelohanellus kitauei TaxID=669202 RepID=A0A0C2JWR0_THEKT|nr:hypothetical protein RF11_15615 [Thelohanellus kitauei]